MHTEKLIYISYIKEKEKDMITDLIL